MIRMKDSLIYIIFSGMEYITLILFVVSVFNMSFKTFYKDILISGLSLTFLSYLLMINKVHLLIPLPIVLIPVLFVFFHKLFLETFLKSIILTISGFIFYGIIQYFIVGMILSFSVLELDELFYEFSSIGNNVQLVCSLLTLIIAIFIKATNSGFGFMMLSTVAGIKKMIVYNVCTMLGFIIIFWALYYFKNLLFFSIALATSILAGSIILILAYQREYKEFSN